jgi:DNA mismatch endonuclease (patch repair protein)
MLKTVKSQPSASRSFNMSKIRSKNTRAEILLRKAMWKCNIRYRIHTPDIPGKPDILIKKYRLAIFVDGGFWHGYLWETNKFRIKTNSKFWINKIEGNIKRDILVNGQLKELGYTIMRFWDHEVIKDLNKCRNQILLYIESMKEGEIPDYE